MTETDAENVLKLVKALFLLAMLPVAIVLRGCAVMLLWSWFVVPILPVRPIDVLEGAGLSIMVGCLIGRKHVKEEFGEMLGRMFVGPILVIGVGYVLHVIILWSHR